MPPVTKAKGGNTRAQMEFLGQAILVWRREGNIYGCRVGGD